MLIGARFVQGVGGALSSAVILGMIVTLFPEPGEQARAIGVFSFVASAGASIGLLAGGVLTEALDWHWIFFVNVPIGAGRLAPRRAAARAGDRRSAGRRRRRARRGPRHRRADARRLHDRRRTLASLLGVLAVGPAGGVRRAPGDRGAPAAAAARAPVSQRRGRERRADADGGRTCSACSSSRCSTSSGVLGYDALATGTAFLPLSIAIGTLSLGFSARLITRFGARAVLIPGAARRSSLGLAFFARAAGRRQLRRRPAARDAPARRRRAGSRSRR